MIDRDLSLEQKRKIFTILGIGILAVAAAAFVLQNQKTGGNGADQETVKAVTTVSEPQAGVTIAMKNTRFQSSPTIKPGTVVKFVNKDSYRHTVQISSTNTFASVPANSAVKLKFKEKGTYQIICTLHPGMTTKIKVI